MKTWGRTRITFSKDEVTIIRKLQGLAQAPCPECGKPVDMATPEQAVTLTGVHSRVIYGWVERGQVHFTETADGHLLICLTSLRETRESALQQTQELVSPGKSRLLPATNE